MGGGRAAELRSQHGLHHRGSAGFVLHLSDDRAVERHAPRRDADTDDGHGQPGDGQVQPDHAAVRDGCRLLALPGGEHGQHRRHSGTSRWVLSTWAASPSARRSARARSTANLIASPAILQTPSSTAYTITATFTPSSGSNHDGSSGTGALTVIHDDNALTYTGPVVIANGQPATLSATMTANGGAAQVSGRTLTFTLGSGGSAQQCTAATTSSGVGTWTIPQVNQPVGPGASR